MRWPDGRYIQGAIFFSRWFIAPFLLGLLLCQLALMYRFFGDLFALAVQVPRMNWHDTVTGVLNLVDLALTANLILIVIFSSYENFVGIAAVDALAWYFDLDKPTDTSKLGWVLGFPLVFAAVMLMLAVADRLGRRPEKKPD
jgi:uncharacterized membrane protein YqhA